MKKMRKVLLGLMVILAVTGVISCKKQQNSNNNTQKGNLLWSWDKENQAWTSLAPGKKFISKGFDNITVMTVGKTISNDNGGIRLGSKANGRLVIGSVEDKATTADDKVDTVNGEFNLANRPVKVTINYENMVSFENKYVLRVYVNNNTASYKNSFLGDASVIAACYGNTHSGKIGQKTIILNEASGTITVTIDPAKFKADQKRTLEKAFICLHSQTSENNSDDNGITITSIKIE